MAKAKPVKSKFLVICEDENGIAIDEPYNTKQDAEAAVNDKVNLQEFKATECLIYEVINSYEAKCPLTFVKRSL